MQGAHALEKEMATHSSILAWRITFTFHFHALEKEMATHSNILAWRIPGTEEPVGLPSMGLHSQTQLTRLSSSSNSFYGQDQGLIPGQGNKIPQASCRIVRALSFSWHEWSCTRICLCNQTSIKALDPKTWTNSPEWRHSAYVLCLERKYVVYGFCWGGTWKPVSDLSGFCPLCIFFC